MRKDSITGKMIWKELRTAFAMAFWFKAWLLTFPALFFYSIFEIIKNEDDEFPKIF